MDVDPESAQMFMDDVVCQDKSTRAICAQCFATTSGPPAWLDNLNERHGGS